MPPEALREARPSSLSLLELALKLLQELAGYSSPDCMDHHSDVYKLINLLYPLKTSVIFPAL